MTEPVAYMWKIITGFTPNYNSDSGGQLGIPIYKAEQLHPRVKMTQAEFDELETSLINAQFDYSELKKTIEIVPTMKWFVRSKSSDEKYGYWYLNKTENYFFHEYIKELSTQFNTKEEAEKWINPLTESVQLPVEDE